MDSHQPQLRTRVELRDALDELLLRVDVNLPRAAVFDTILDALHDFFGEDGDQQPTEYTEPECPVEVYAALPEGVDIREVDLLVINLRHDRGVDTYHMERDELGMLYSTTGSQTIPDAYAPDALDGGERDDDSNGAGLAAHATGEEAP